MSYLVLARKWRPARFQDLLGQDHVAVTLSNAIKTDRVAHAFLFTGVRGVGKTSAARILSMALNCESGDVSTPDPCGTCDSCRQVMASSSMDVHEIDGASNNSVEDVRNLRETVAYRSSWARLLKRTLQVDALTCPRCSEAMVVLAFITDPAVVKKILNHLHLPSADPPRAPARIPFEHMTAEEEFGEQFPDDSFPSSTTRQRGPP